MGLFSASFFGYGVTLRTPISDGTKGQAIVTDAEKKLNFADVMRWDGEWESKLYGKHQVVRDDDWLMIANKETEDNAAPHPIGTPAYVYDGTLAANSALAKSVIFGTRYTAQQDLYLSGYRVYLHNGIHYEIYVIYDPAVAVEIRKLVDITANSDGWVELGIVPTPIQIGKSIDIVCLADKPDPSPVTWQGNWDYLTPNNVGTPAVGKITHASKRVANLHVNKIDNDGGDRGAELLALTVGDNIVGAGMNWDIRAVADQGTYVDFSVLPSEQGTNGVSLFTFETATATPIPYGVDNGYYASAPGASGLLAIDSAYGDIVPDDNAYGVDVLLQDANISPDWDVMAYFGK